MDPIDKDALKQVDSLLASNSQAWLFGAGISKSANVPLMLPLTNRVFALATNDSDKRLKEILDVVKAELADNAHIEHILSHLGDLATIAERCKSQQIHLGTGTLFLRELRDLHSKVLQWISEIVRWGYVEASGAVSESIGSRDSPIVTVDAHLRFASALFSGQAGVVERRGAVKFFTTNYDTLLEDALALGSFHYWDGFSGGAIAFRNHRYGQNDPQSGYRAHVIKMHGSIDWHLGTDDKVWRVRDGDIYPTRSTRVLIYPQSTKYLATQRDPFASQFDLFRRALCSSSENVLAVCGYSFGDEHINQEIELAMHRPDNKTTILAFSSSIGETLKKWQTESWSKRLYILSESGLYVGSEGPLFPPPAGCKLDWWTFSGVTNLLKNGAEACVP